MNNILAGILIENNNGSYTFRYEDEYLSNPEYSSITLTLPKRQQIYHSETLFPFFFNILSEGKNKQIQCHKFKVGEEDVFGLLLATAHSNVIGAITVKKLLNV
jgi:serine/threonine-protein kinase HipA